jgi:hypothetical protein
VPVTELWFVEGTDYLGTVIIRHRLTPALEREGGHIGYHVVPGQDQAGNDPAATRANAQAEGSPIVTAPRHNPTATYTHGSPGRTT